MHNNILHKKIWHRLVPYFFVPCLGLLAFDVCREAVVETMFLVGCVFLLLNDFPIVFCELGEERIGLARGVLYFGEA